MFDSRHHITDALGRGAVQTLKPMGFGDTTGRDGIATGNHLCFGLGPTFWLVVTCLGLDSGKRVERGHQRNIKAMFDPMSSDTRQPVIGV